MASYIPHSSCAIIFEARYKERLAFHKHVAVNLPSLLFDTITPRISVHRGIRRIAKVAHDTGLDTKGIGTSRLATLNIHEPEYSIYHSKLGLVEYSIVLVI